MSSQVKVSFRIATSLVERLDALAEKLAQDATIAPTGKFKRSDAIRAAVVRGLEVLEKEHLLQDE